MLGLPGKVWNSREIENRELARAISQRGRKGWELEVRRKEDLFFNRGKTFFSIEVRPVKET